MDYNSVVNQGIKGKFVEREVVYNVSSLIQDLCQHEDYQDELMFVLSQDDWTEPALDYARSQITEDECRDYLDYYDEYYEDATLDELRAQVIEALNQYEEFCDAHGLECHVNDALEHWIVTDYLADKLEGQGEMVLKDFLGLTVWGRCCSGQAISLDPCISYICDDMEILEGQKYSWAEVK